MRLSLENEEQLIGWNCHTDVKFEEIRHQWWVSQKLLEIP